MTRLSEPVI
jgi:hypothetical protein